jgi:hypothetical protein
MISVVSGLQARIATGHAFRVCPTIYNYFGSIITSVPSTKDGDQ